MKKIDEATRFLVEIVAQTQGEEEAARLLFRLHPEVVTATIGEYRKGDAKTYHRKDLAEAKS